MLSSVPAWAVADSGPSIDELRSDLRRAVVVLSQISIALDAFGSASGLPSVRIFESCPGSEGSLPLPMSLPLETLPT
jgi:hypothetical protein